MIGATHFIEQYTNKGKLIIGQQQGINDLKRSLTITKNSKDLKTIAVLFIKCKIKNHV